jgi:glutamate synthase (NADPH/NADH) small chain
MPQPPERENKALTWPNWPLKLRTSSSQEEGDVKRDFAVLTKEAVGAGGKLEGLKCVKVDWATGPDGRMHMSEVADSEFVLRADLVLLAMGFLGPHKSALLEQSGVELDVRGNVKATMTDYRTTAERIFSCGDMRRGQSLVVWAIREGRQCARAVDEFLMGASDLPR